MKLPRAYVINLARSPDRLAGMRDRLERAGLEWVRVDAVDGRQFGDPPWENFDDFTYNYLWGMHPHPNELGCYLSHHRALQAFLDSGEETALILEDDAVLSDDIGEVLNDLLDNADQWDVVKLDSRHWGMPVTTYPLRKGRRLVAYTQRNTGAAGYVTNRKAAEAYVRRLLPMKVPYDHAFDQAWRFGFRMRGVLPRPVTPGGFASDIGYAATPPRRMFFRRTVTPLYKAQIEIARALHYLIRDPVWLAWLRNSAFSRAVEDGSGKAD